MSEYITNIDTIKNLGNLTAVKEEKITPHLLSAKIKVIDLIGQTNYDLLIDAGNEHPNAGNPFTKEDFDKASIGEAYMVVSLLVRPLNTETSGAGITKSTGFNNSKKENLSEMDVDKMIMYYRDESKNTLKAYTKSIDTDLDGKNDQVVVEGIKMTSI